MNDDATTTHTAADPTPTAKLGTLRALWPFVRRHGGLFTAWLLALALASAATLSLPVAFRQMIDNGFTDGANINRAFLFLFVVAVVLALASAARFYFVSLLGEKVVADLRGQLYGHLIGLDAEFHDRTRSGELVSRLSADSELLRTVVATSMSVALRSSVTVIGSLAMLFVTSPRLAAFAPAFALLHSAILALARSSRVTGPKMRVPIGSCLLLSSTAALPSKRISEPSGRRTPLRVRTTTAS